MKNEITNNKAHKLSKIELDIEKEVEKIIKLSFPMYSNSNWDDIIIDTSDSLENQYLKLIEHLIIKEKDKILFNATSLNYLRKRVFFDIYYNFNDTLNKIKKSTIDLVNILNEQ